MTIWQSNNFNNNNNGESYPRLSYVQVKKKSESTKMEKTKSFTLNKQQGCRKKKGQGKN